MYVGYAIDEEYIKEFLMWKSARTSQQYKDEVLPELGNKGMLAKMFAKRKFKNELAKWDVKHLKSLKLRKDEDGNVFYTMRIAGQNYCFKNFEVSVDGYFSKEDTKDWVQFNSETIGADYIRHFKLIQRVKAESDTEYYLGEYAQEKEFRIIGVMPFKQKETGI